MAIASEVSIKNAAIELLARAGITEPPVDVHAVAALLNARVRFELADDSISGLAVREDGELIIGVNSRHAETRRRFTIAHEIGHLVLHQDEAVHIDTGFVFIGARDEMASAGFSRKEIEANRFAAALLMPDHFLRSDIRKLRLTIDLESDVATAQLARLYKVSTHAMAIRLSSVFGSQI